MRKIELMVKPSDTIRSGKILYNNLINSSDSYQWKFDGIVLNDDKEFEYYEIENGDRIISSNRRRGGGN